MLYRRHGMNLSQTIEYIFKKIELNSKRLVPQSEFKRLKRDVAELYERVAAIETALGIQRARSISEEILQSFAEKFDRERKASMDEAARAYPEIANPENKKPG